MILFVACKFSVVAIFAISGEVEAGVIFGDEILLSTKLLLLEGGVEAILVLSSVLLISMVSSVKSSNSILLLVTTSGLWIFLLAGISFSVI